MEGGVQEVLEHWTEVFKKCWMSLRSCSICAGGMETGVQYVLKYCNKMFKKR